MRSETPDAGMKSAPWMPEEFSRPRSYPWPLDLMSPVLVAGVCAAHDKEER